MTEREKKIKLWKQVLKLRASGLTFAQVGKVTGITRQRCHQIIGHAKNYVASHDDELAQWIKKELR